MFLVRNLSNFSRKAFAFGCLLLSSRSLHLTFMPGTKLNSLHLTGDIFVLRYKSKLLCSYVFKIFVGQTVCPFKDTVFRIKTHTGHYLFPGEKSTWLHLWWRHLAGQIDLKSSISYLLPSGSVVCSAVCYLKSK